MAFIYLTFQYIYFELMAFIYLTFKYIYLSWMPLFIRHSNIFTLSWWPSQDPILPPAGQDKNGIITVSKVVHWFWKHMPVPIQACADAVSPSFRIPYIPETHFGDLRIFRKAINWKSLSGNHFLTISRWPEQSNFESQVFIRSIRVKSQVKRLEITVKSGYMGRAHFSGRKVICSWGWNDQRTRKNKYENSGFHFLFSPLNFKKTVLVLFNRNAGLKSEFSWCERNENGKL